MRSADDEIQSALNMLRIQMKKQVKAGRRGAPNRRST